MPNEFIDIEKLQVNPENYRHNPFDTEREAIEWLLKEKFSDMKNLLKDIIFQNGILEHPLVKEEGDKYLVYDGNRRVACMKILLGKLPEGFDQNLYAKISLEIPGNYKSAGSAIECRVESDIRIIDRLLETRHIPGQSGAGQLNWDPHQKESFYKRTEKYEKIGFPRKINEILIKNNALSATEEINLSTFERLFGNSENKERVGFKVNQDNEIEITKDPEKVFKALAHIARDKETLNNLWNAEKKKKYLDSLEKKNILPKENDVLEESILIKYEDVINDRLKLIPQKKEVIGKKRKTFFVDVPAPVPNKYLSRKACALFNEFNQKMKIGTYPVSRTIIFRSLLDIFTCSYIRKHALLTEMELKSNDFPLKSKIGKVVSHFAGAGNPLKESTRKYIERFKNETNLDSIGSLNDSVHNDFYLAPETLDNIGSNLEDYFCRMIEDLNEAEDKNS